VKKQRRSAPEIASLMIAEYKRQCPDDGRLMTIAVFPGALPHSNWDASASFSGSAIPPFDWMEHWFLALATVQGQVDLECQPDSAVEQEPC
jgi:hypothetical protein